MCSILVTEGRDYTKSCEEEEAVWPRTDDQIRCDLNLPLWKKRADPEGNIHGCRLSGWRGSHLGSAWEGVGEKLKGNN